MFSVSVKEKTQSKSFYNCPRSLHENDTRIETLAARKCCVSICSIHTDSNLHCHQSQLSLSAAHLLMC